MDNANPAEGLDPFSRVLPLPFRLLFEFIGGIWLWALNLHAFHRRDIDICTLIHYPARPTAEEPPLHRATYRLAVLLSGLWMGAMLLFWHVTRGDAALVVSSAWIPNLLAAVVVALLLLPRGRWSPLALVGGSANAYGTRRLAAGVWRCAPGGIAKAKGEKFGDVLLADALTSYAKPISEVVVAACMFFQGRGTTDQPDRRCGRGWVVPLAIAWPFAIRWRQCVKEKQWANAVKYATAFPVIALSAWSQKDDTLKGLWFVPLFLYIARGHGILTGDDII